MNKKIKSKKTDPTCNNYLTLDKEFLEDKIEYDNFDEVNISFPANIALLGTTGSFKTNFLVNLIKDTGVFNKIVLYLANPEQPLYKSLIKKIRALEVKEKTSILEIFDNIDNVKSPLDIDPSENTLVVFDDFQNEKVSKQKNIIDLFTRGRTRQVTCVYIAQTYYKGIPAIIRGNLQYLIIFKVQSPSDLARILADRSLGVDKKQLMNMYMYVKSQSEMNFLMIDSKTNNPALRFRINYDPLICKE